MSPVGPFGAVMSPVADGITHHADQASEGACRISTGKLGREELVVKTYLTIEHKICISA